MYECLSEREREIEVYVHNSIEREMNLYAFRIYMYVRTYARNCYYMETASVRTYNCADRFIHCATHEMQTPCTCLVLFYFLQP